MSITISYNATGYNCSKQGVFANQSIHSFRELATVAPLLLCLTVPLPNQNNSIQTLHNSVRNGMVQVLSTVGEVLDMKMQKNLERLNDMAMLRENWDGYGAKGFSATLIEKCKRILGELSRQPDIYPTSRQSVHMQYELEDHSYLGFEIFESKTECLKVPRRVYAEAVTLKFEGPDEVKKIEESVAEFYGYSSIAD